MDVAELIDLLHSFDAALPVVVADDEGESMGMQITSLRGISVPMEGDAVLIEFSLNEGTVFLPDA